MVRLNAVPDFLHHVRSSIATISSVLNSVGEGVPSIAYLIQVPGLYVCFWILLFIINNIMVQTQTYKN